MQNKTECPHQQTEYAAEQKQLARACIGLLLLPRTQNWLTTTAPPVASAANSTMMRLLIMSTRLTPEMAASPQRDTIMVSAIPTVTSSSCSTSSGPVSSSSSFCVNSGFRPPKSGFLFRSPPDFPLICSFPRAGPSRSDTYAHPSQGRLPIECIHLSTRTGSCKELSHSASFCRRSGPHRLILCLFVSLPGTSR